MEIISWGIIWGGKYLHLNTTNEASPVHLSLFQTNPSSLLRSMPKANQRRSMPDQAELICGIQTIQGGITPIADSVMCMPVAVNFATEWKSISNFLYKL